MGRVELRSHSVAASDKDKPIFKCVVCGAKKGSFHTIGGRCAKCGKEFCLECSAYRRVRTSGTIENDYELVCGNCA